MPQEIERKFLVNKVPEITENIMRYEILQGYVLISESMEIRLRKKSDKYFQTIKTGEGLNRGEYEIEIQRGQFELLWPLTESKRIEKTRYEIVYNNSLIELDIYKDSLDGLVTAEVEFHSEKDSTMFIPPDWFGKDVTNDKRYKNKNLALDGCP